METLTTALSALESRIKTYDTSANVVYDIIGQYDGNTHMPIYEFEIKSQIANQDDIFRQATIQLNYHTSSTSNKLSVSGFNEKIKKDKELRQLIEEWAEEMSQSAISFGSLQRISSTIHSLDRSEMGEGNKGYRIFLEFDINYR